VEHEDGYVARMVVIGSDEEGAERLAIWCGNEQLFIIGDGELRRPGYVCSSVGGEGTGVYDFTTMVS
jgi:hypothetical protein